jgi:hypothetical protein
MQRDDNMKKINEMIYTVIILTLALLFIFLAVLLGGHLLKVSGLSNWDPLAFVGAIVGGLLTLLGVNKTIKVQQRKDATNDFPKKQLHGDEIFETMENYLSFLERVINDEYLQSSGYPAQQIIENLNGFNILSKELLVKSADISGPAYLHVKHFIDTINEYSDKVITRTREDDGLDVKRTMMNYRNWLETLNSIKDSFQKEMDCLEQEFYKVIS